MPKTKPRIDPNTLPTEVFTTAHQAPQPLNPSSLAIRTLKLKPSSTMKKLAISSATTIPSITVSPRTSR